MSLMNTEGTSIAAYQHIGQPGAVATALQLGLSLQTWLSDCGGQLVNQSKPDLEWELSVEEMFGHEQSWSKVAKHTDKVLYARQVALAVL